MIEMVRFLELAEKNNSTEDHIDWISFNRIFKRIKFQINILKGYNPVSYIFILI